MSRTVKRSNVGGYLIEVKSQPDNNIYRYLAYCCANVLKQFDAAGDDKAAMTDARDSAVAVCECHYQSVDLRRIAYAAVGGVLLAKYGYGEIERLSAEQLSIVIDSPRRLVDFVGGGV